MGTTTTSEQVHVHDCPACTAIDEADGVVDGNLFPVLEKRIGHGNHVVEALKDAEDRVADRVTAFAGSLPFVYIHTVWFGMWIALNVGLCRGCFEVRPVSLRAADHDRHNKRYLSDASKNELFIDARFVVVYRILAEKWATRKRSRLISTLSYAD